MINPEDYTTFGDTLPAEGTGLEMETNACSNCRHWQDGGDGMGICILISDGQTDRVMVMGPDGSGEFYCAPEFSCSEWAGGDEYVPEDGFSSGEGFGPTGNGDEPMAGDGWATY